MKRQKMQLQITQDQSPTLCHNMEFMHNKKGAFSESLHIYYKALKKAHKLTQNTRCYCLSLGLGLGYNEMLWAVFFILHKRALGSWRLASFEKDTYLNSCFLKWVQFSLPQTHLLYQAYEMMERKIEKHFAIEKHQVRRSLLEQHQAKNWILNEGLNFQTKPYPFQCILYDAYSEASCSKLWNLYFLYFFIENFTDSLCVFSTYAAKGSLTRLLVKKSFKVDILSGFGGKRHFTWAVRKRFG